MKEKRNKPRALEEIAKKRGDEKRAFSILASRMVGASLFTRWISVEIAIDEIHVETEPWRETERGEL